MRATRLRVRIPLYWERRVAYLRAAGQGVAQPAAARERARRLHHEAALHAQYERPSPRPVKERLKALDGGGYKIQTGRIGLHI